MTCLSCKGDYPDDVERCPKCQTRNWKNTCIAQIASTYQNDLSVRCASRATVGRFCSDHAHDVTPNTEAAKPAKFRSCEVSGCKNKAMDGFKCVVHLNGDM